MFTSQEIDFRISWCWISARWCLGEQGCISRSGFLGHCLRALWRTQRNAPKLYERISKSKRTHIYPYMKAESFYKFPTIFRSHSEAIFILFFLFTFFSSSFFYHFGAVVVSLFARLFSILISTDNWVGFEIRDFFSASINEINPLRFKMLNQSLEVHKGSFYMRKYTFWRVSSN